MCKYEYYYLHKKSHPGNQKKILCQDSPFVVKEAYSSIRTNLLFMQKGEKCPVFVVTSPTANNGKTINSINLAISFAQMGKRTLLIDGDTVLVGFREADWKAALQ